MTAKSPEVKISKWILKRMTTEPKEMWNLLPSILMRFSVLRGWVSIVWKEKNSNKEERRNWGSQALFTAEYNEECVGGVVASGKGMTDWDNSKVGHWMSR